MNENNQENKFDAISIPDFNKKPTLEPVLNIEEKLESVKEEELAKAKSDYTFKIIFYGVLTLVVLGSAYYIFKYSKEFTNTNVPTEERGLVFENNLVRATRSRVVSIEEGASKDTMRSIIIQALLHETAANGEVVLVMPSYLRETIVSGSKKLISELVRGDDFFFTFAVRAPLNLRTIAAENYAVGIVGTSNGQKNFLAYSVNSAPDATREMLRYETQIYEDLKNILQLREIKGNLNFKDLSENNHLFRVAYDDDGVVMVYGFGAPKTIIVAPDTQTFQTVYLNLK